MKRTFILLLILALVIGAPPTNAEDGAAGSSNYMYDEFGTVTPSVPAYAHSASYMASAIEGVDNLKNMQDAFVTDDKVYVLCLSQLIVFDYQFNVLSLSTGYIGLDGRETKFDSSTGIFVTDDGDYYICEANRSRILHFGSDGTLKRMLDAPNITGIDPSVKYRPTKLVVDDAGRMFVVAKGMYEGIVELNPDGVFSSFYGVNEVKFSLWGLLWRNLATDTQRAKQSLWLPTDFTNLCIDDDGFIFATVQSSSAAESVMRLNAKGENILRYDETYPQGDLWYNRYTSTGAPVGQSEFVSVDANDFGVYICLDNTRSRIFAYNEDGKLLFIFGGPGNREGYFRGPVDADFLGDSIMVLDSTGESIEIFTVTKYGQALMNAVEAQYNFSYQVAETYWREALSYNQNLFIAYSGIGRSLLRHGDYEQALEYLKLGADRKYYSKAFAKVRNERLETYLIPVFFSLIGLAIVVKIGKRVWKAKRSKKLGTLPGARREEAL